MWLWVSLGTYTIRRSLYPAADQSLCKRFGRWCPHLGCRLVVRRHPSQWWVVLWKRLQQPQLWPAAAASRATCVWCNYVWEAKLEACVAASPTQAGLCPTNRHQKNSLQHAPPPPPPLLMMHFHPVSASSSCIIPRFSNVLGKHSSARVSEWVTLHGADDVTKL